MGIKIEDIKCNKCGINITDASLKGIYFKRVNPKGEIPFINECAPSCGVTIGDNETALLNAIKGA